MSRSSSVAAGRHRSSSPSGNVWVGAINDCGVTGTPTQRLDTTGAFTAPATIDVRLRCGSVSLGTRPGGDWAVAGAYEGAPPVVTGSGDRLEVRVPEGGGVRRDDLTVTAPADRLESVVLQSNAASSSVRLDGASVSTLTVDSNAGDALIDGSTAVIREIDVSMNAGRARITLGGGPTTGTLKVNVGAIDLCVPAGAELRLTVPDQLTFVTNLGTRGLHQDGQTWTRAASTGGSPIDLRIEGNAGSFTLDPDGGCR